MKKMQPDIGQAAALGVRPAIENHTGFLSSPESVRYLADAITAPNVGMAYVPYHLPPGRSAAGSTDSGSRPENPSLGTRSSGSAI